MRCDEEALETYVKTNMVNSNFQIFSNIKQKLNSKIRPEDRFDIFFRESGCNPPPPPGENDTRSR